MMRQWYYCYYYGAWFLHSLNELHFCTGCSSASAAMILWEELWLCAGGPPPSHAAESLAV